MVVFLADAWPQIGNLDSLFTYHRKQPMFLLLVVRDLFSCYNAFKTWNNIQAWSKTLLPTGNNAISVYEKKYKAIN